MAKFKTAAKIISTVQEMKLVDLPRSSNRALIDELFNGFPPYTDHEARENKIEVNVNFLEPTNLAHQARQQFANAMLTSANYFSVQCDFGPAYRQQEYSSKISKGLGRIMKRKGFSARAYRENLRSIFGQLVLHGVGPLNWQDEEHWAPKMIMIGDVLLPSKTLLTMENVEYFGVFKQYTPAKLWRMTHGAQVDPGWNMKLVDRCLAWAHAQWGQTNSSNDYIYSPEKIQEDYKADLGIYATDQVPTIDCWDFYYLNDSGKEWKWNRRIVLDTPSGSDVGQTKIEKSKRDQSAIGGSKSEFLYDSREKKYASSMEEIIHFQFADGSSVAPFRYHSIRSLGWLLYSVCHLQNRLRCRINEHAFENLLQYFRTSNPDDAEKLTHIDLINRGVIPDGVMMVPQTERWQINQGLVDTVMSLNRQCIQDSSTSYTQDYERMRDKTDKTATQVTAELNASTALIGAMLNEAYGYEEFKNEEIARRFCIQNSRDPDVRQFRADMIKEGVPEGALDSRRWNISTDRVMGSGNKQLEIAQSNMLMESFQLFDPDAQRLVLRQRVFAITSDPSFTDSVVPIKRQPVSDSRHDAQNAAGSLLLGLPVDLKEGYNHIDYVEALLGSLTQAISQTEQSGGMATAQQIAGFTNLANAIQQHIGLIARDKKERARVKQYSDDLGKLMNLVKAYQQRLAEQQQQQQGNGHLDPKDQAKIQGTILMAQTKAQLAQQSHAQRTKQRQEQHQLQMANKIRETQVQESATDLRTAAEIKRGRFKTGTE